MVFVLFFCCRLCAYCKAFLHALAVVLANTFEKHPILHQGAFNEKMTEEEGPHDNSRGVILCQQSEIHQIGPSLLFFNEITKKHYRSTHGTSLSPSPAQPRLPHTLWGVCRCLAATCNHGKVSEEFSGASQNRYCWSWCFVFPTTWRKLTVCICAYLYPVLFTWLVKCRISFKGR